MEQKQNQEKEAHYLGHRERLRTKLLENGDSSLADYELLELLLTIIIPRRDVKPLAKELIKKFGTFGDVINAKPVELEKINGIGKTASIAFQIIKSSITRSLKTKIEKSNVISSWPELLDYCKSNIGTKKTEEFHVLYLNTKCKLIKDETHSTGTINSSSVYPREILKRVLELGASSIIIAHNHPTGDTAPSNADINITKKIRDILKTIDVPLHDHLIIGANDVLSFKTLGLL